MSVQYPDMWRKLDIQFHCRQRTFQNHYTPDTLFLARQVGPDGAVWSFDVQAMALAQARLRLREVPRTERARPGQAMSERMTTIPK